MAILSGSKSSEVPTSDLVKTHKIKYGVNEITSIIGIPRIGFEWKYPNVNVSPMG